MHRFIVAVCLLAIFSMNFVGCSSSHRSRSQNPEWETPYGCKFQSEYLGHARKSSPVYFDGLDIDVLKESSVAVIQSKKPLVFAHKGGNEGFYSFYVEETPYEADKHRCSFPSQVSPENFIVMEIKSVKATEVKPANAAKKETNQISLQTHALTLLVDNTISSVLRAKVDDSHHPPTVVQDRIRNLSYLLEEAMLNDSRVASVCNTRSKTVKTLSREIVESTNIHIKCLAEKERYEKLAVLKNQRVTPNLVKKEVAACVDDKAFGGIPDLEL